jgi:hypothetical protein
MASGARQTPVCEGNRMKRRIRPAVVGFALLGATVACTRASFEPVPDGAVDGRDGSSSEPETGGDAGEAAAPFDARICSAPVVPGCSPATTGTCDPVCQTGACDWCGQKCGYVYASSAGGLAVVCAPRGSGTFPQGCAVQAAGSPQQADDCAPGSVCLAPTIGDNLTYCFTLCRTPADCAYGVACAARKLSAAGGEVSVCDPPYEQCGLDGTCCDPLSNTGCALHRYCLLVSPDLGTAHSRTVCDFTYGDGRNGAPCTTSRDCQLRNVCVDNTCQQICTTAVPCPAGQGCVALGSEFGYCL